MFTVYGIKNCDSCKTAIKDLGSKALFWDIRSSPLSKEVLESFHATFGDKLVNSNSKTWRLLSSTEKLMPPIELLQRFPTLMKRPVVECPETSYRTIGWNDAIKMQYT